MGGLWDTVGDVMIHKLIYCFLLTALAAIGSGCASVPAKPGPVAFTSSNVNALIVFGADVQTDYRDVRFVLSQYDVATGKSSGKPVEARPVTSQGSELSGHRVVAVELPPGDWYLWGVVGTYRSKLGTSNDVKSYFANGTILFTAHAGRAAYIGEFEISGALPASPVLTQLRRRHERATAEIKREHTVMPRSRMFVP